MTSIVKFHCISGGADETPPCYVLQIDEFKFLLDCGWDELFNMDFIKELKRHVNTIDAVLISQSDPLHLGALPYAIGKLGLNCPVYATLPIYKMGQMFMYDLYQAHKNVSEFDLFTLDDVDAAFDKMVQLKYNQSVDMKGKGLGLRITPLPAGHMLGGTIWRISAPGEEDIVYAPDLNHKKERHLNGCDVEQLLRPSLMILGAMNADYVQPRRRLRDEKLMTAILSTVRGGGCALVASDTAGRVLELAHTLEQLWRNAECGLGAYPLLLLSHVAYNVLEFAKSQIEWMSDKLTRAFEGARSNPFALRHVQLCHSLAEVARAPGPKVVLASFPDLEAGFARDLFLQWAPSPANTLILTSRTSPGTLARELCGGARVVELRVRRRVRLDARELEEHLALRRRPGVVKKEPALDSESDSDSSLEMHVVTGRHDLPARRRARRPAMFPAPEERHRHDDYGEAIRPEDYRLSEAPEPGEARDAAPPQPAQPVEEELSEIPTKCVSTTRALEVRCGVQLVELEGRADSDSLLRLLLRLRPRRVLCARTPPAAAAVVRKHCEAAGIEVFTPARGESVDATTETHIYQVKLSESLMSELQWLPCGDVQLAWLSARVQAPHEPEASTDDVMDWTPSLAPHAEGGADGAGGAGAGGAAHTARFFKELRLSELRAALGRAGVPCEALPAALSAGGGTVAVRRLESSRVVLEGVLSDEYYRVRDVLYDQFAIV